MLEMNSGKDDSTCRARRGGNGSTIRPSGPSTTRGHGSISVRTSDNLTTAEDLYLLNKLNNFMSPTSQTGSEIKRLIQDTREPFHFFDDDPSLQQLQRPEHIQVFASFQKKMGSKIGDFASSQGISTGDLVESARRLHHRPEGLASSAVAYMLAVDGFESFMALMDGMPDPFSPTKAICRRTSWVACSSNATGAKEASELNDSPLTALDMMDLEHGFDTDMAASSRFEGASSTISLDHEHAHLLAIPTSDQRINRSTVDHRNNGSSGRSSSTCNRTHNVKSGSLHNSDYCCDDSMNGSGGSIAGDDDGHNNDDAESRFSTAGSEEEFSEPHPSDPADGCLPCLARRRESPNEMR